MSILDELTWRGLINDCTDTEALTKRLGVAVLLTDATRRSLRSAATLREMPPQEVKGVTEPLRVYTFSNTPAVGV